MLEKLREYLCETSAVHRETRVVGAELGVHRDRDACGLGGDRGRSEGIADRTEDAPGRDREHVWGSIFQEIAHQRREAIEVLANDGDERGVILARSEACLEGVERR